MGEQRDSGDDAEGDEPEPVEDLNLRACPCHDNPGDGRAVIYYWSGFQKFLLMIGAADAEEPARLALSADAAMALAGALLRMAGRIRNEGHEGGNEP